jgi:dihydrofolate reductase
MRKLIAGMRTTVDGKIDGAEGYADWVADWSDGYDLMSHVDACLLGGKNYPGYEAYWTAVQDGPDQPHPLTGRVPTSAEREWADFAARTPHYVLSTTVESAAWPNTRFLRKADEVEALKQDVGKDIYLVGGAKIIASLIDAGLVDELRLLVYPLVAGEGKPLFEANQRRRGLALRNADQLTDGRLSLTYEIN